jgi:hypothetical protein
MAIGTDPRPRSAGIAEDRETHEDHAALPADRRDAGGRILSGTRYLLVAFAVLTALATNQLLVLGGHTDRYWPWTIQSRPTVGFLGAAYAAGFLLSVLSLRRREWRHVRVAVATVTAFTVLTLIPTLVHAHRLHLSDPDPMARAAAWFWVAVYLVVPLAGLAVLARQEQQRRGRDVVLRPLPTWLRVVLGAQGAVLAAAGLALFLGGLTIHHGTTTTGVWPWPVTPIAAQVIGAWLIAFGLGAGLVLAERDLSRLRVPAIAYAGFGAFQLVVLLVYGAQMNGALWAYGIVMGAVALTGGYGWWTTGRGRDAAVTARP